ncbi:Endoribonuclease L-PSP/chorismate mutase-like protein [Mycena galericulata]|nr:Endoribonuclease L-PSP/chorismate mutase-like protein [Mycena galericulata]
MLVRAQALRLVSSAFTRSAAQSSTRHLLSNPSAVSFRKMASLTPIFTKDAPAAVGPYSQAVKLGDLLFCSGCIPLDPGTATVVGDTIKPQTEQALKNMKAVLEAGGSSPDRVVKTTVFLQSMDHFAEVNAIYEKFFGEHKPARSCVEVSRLPKNVLVEVECIASIKQ